MEVREGQCPGVSEGPARPKLWVTFLSHPTQCDKMLENLKRWIFVPEVCKRGSAHCTGGRDTAVPESVAVLLEPVSWVTSPAFQFHVGPLPLGEGLDLFFTLIKAFHFTFPECSATES